MISQIEAMHRKTFSVHANACIHKIDRSLSFMAETLVGYPSWIEAIMAQTLIAYCAIGFVLRMPPNSVVLPACLVLFL